MGREPWAVSSEERQDTPTVKSSCQSTNDQIYRANRIFGKGCSISFGRGDARFDELG
jgi:hypothetical protein